MKKYILQHGQAKHLELKNTGFVKLSVIFYKNSFDSIRENLSFKKIIFFVAPPSLPPSLPEYTEVVENNPVILPCPAQGSPRPRIVWTKNGVPLTGNELGIEFLEDGSLEIESALAADSGAYKCLAHNVAGNVSHAVDLKILGKYLVHLFVKWQNYL